MNSISTSDFTPATGKLEEWNEAYLRLEDYLRAHNLHDRIHEHQVIQSILQRASTRHAEHPDRHPVTVALQEAQDMMENWFGLILPDQKLSQARLSAAGRVALLVTGAPLRWPRAFLSDHPSDEFLEAVRKKSVQTGPELDVSSMVPRPMDYGPLSDLAGTTLAFDWQSFFKAIAFWAILFAIKIWFYQQFP